MPRPHPSRTRRKNRDADGEFFELRCECGRVIRGTRSKDAQQIECQRCGEWLFLLPADVYPPLSDEKSTRPPERDRSRKESSSPESIASEDDDAPPKTEDPSPKEEEPTVVTTDTGLVLEQPSTLRRLGRVFSPLRIIIVGIFVALAATGYWKIQQRNRERLERLLREHVEAGEAALKERDYVAAVEEFKRAVALIDQLDRDDATARRSRQMLRESQAITGALRPALYETLDSLAALPDRSAAVERFKQQLARGGWIILDAPLRLLADGDSPQVGVDAAIPVGDAIASIEFLGGAAENLHARAQSQRSIVAVEVLDLIWTPDAAPRIRLKAESAFLWTDAANLKAAGFGSIEGDAFDAATLAILARQSQQTGLSHNEPATPE